MNTITDPRFPKHMNHLESRRLIRMFKPSLPEKLLPQDPRPDYVPLFMENYSSPKMGPYICSKCNNRYDSKSFLEKHWNFHHGGTKVQKSHGKQSDCHEPDRKYGKESGERSPSTKSTDGAKCPHCDAVLTYAYNLTKHIEVCRV